MSPAIVRVLLAPMLAAFALQLGVTAVADWRGPGLLGVRGSFRDGTLVVRAVVAGSHAEAWGLEAGDRIVSVADRELEGIARWIAFRAELSTGDPVQLAVERGGRRLQLAADVGPRPPWQGLDIACLTLRLAQLLMLALAAVIALRRPTDGVALLGAWLLASLSASSLVPPSGSTPVIRALPASLAAWLWLPYLSSLHLSSVFLTFVCGFPRPLFSARWPWLAIWTPALVALPWMVPYALAALARPHDVPDVPEVLVTVSVLKNLAYGLGGLALLGIRLRRARSVNERRRIRMVLLAFALGPLATFPAFLAVYFPPAAPIEKLALSLPALIAAYLLAASFPLLFSYAVLKHRLFDLRPLLRQGLRHALARRAMLALVPTLALVLLADLALHGDRTVASLVRERGWIYLSLAALAWIASRFRDRWLDAIDRRFFRPRYDGRRLLASVLASARRARSLEQLGTRVVAAPRPRCARSSPA